MKRAFISLCLLLILAVLTQKANSACDPITVVNNLPDTVKVGFGGKLDLSAEFTAPDIPVDSCGIGLLNWEAKPNGGSPYSVTGTPIASPDTGTAYTISWRPANAETLRLVPYVVDSLTVPTTHYSSDTTVVIVKDGLWYPEAFHYRGAFIIPRRDGTHTGSADFGGLGSGHMIAYCDTDDGTNDGYPGSLFMNGQMYQIQGERNVGGWIAQITIPAPVIDPTENMANLPRASYIQNFHDAFNSPFTNWETTWPHGYANIAKPGDMVFVPAGGQLTYDALYFTYQDTYAIDMDLYAIGRIPADLNDFRPQGLWHLGAWNLPTSGGNWTTNFRSWADYMFPAPLDWATIHCGGRWMIAGMGDREAGTNGASKGPTMFAFNPLFPDRAGSCPRGTACSSGSPMDTSKIPTTRLLQYVPEILTNECRPDSTTRTITDYSRTDSWTGGAWLTHGSKQSIIFSGTKCLFDSHYGSADCPGSNHGACNEVSGWVCGDPGDATPPYRPQIWFYDPDDIADVADGNKNLWEPQPYSTLDLTPYIFNRTDCQTGGINGITYDATNGYLYMSQWGDTTQSGSGLYGPIVHVFDVQPWESYVVDFDIEAAPLYLHIGDSLFVSLSWDLQTTSDCTFATDSTSVASIEIVVADSTYASDSAPLANGATGLFESYVKCPTNGISSIRGRITIDASGTDCDGTYDTPSKSVFVHVNP